MVRMYSLSSATFDNGAQKARGARISNGTAILVMAVRRQVIAANVAR
jgi:hypothetical protein